MAADPTRYYGEDRKGDILAEPVNLKCPSCGQILAATDESGLVNVLQEHLYEEHALDVPRERVRENIVAQLRDFDDYNARPISGPDRWFSRARRISAGEGAVTVGASSYGFCNDVSTNLEEVARRW